MISQPGSDGLSEMLVGWVDRYPIVSVEDPLGEPGQLRVGREAEADELFGGEGGSTLGRTYMISGPF